MAERNNLVARWLPTAHRDHAESELKAVQTGPFEWSAVSPRLYSLLFALGVSAVVLALLVAVLPTGPKIHSRLLLEAGAPLPPAVAFVEDARLETSYSSDTSQVDTRMPGSYPITLSVDGKEHPSSIQVIDTTPPNGTPLDNETWLGERLEATAFVTSIRDATPVDITYKDQPDFDRAGIQLIAVLLTDTSGNQTELTARLTVKADREAPTISGVKDISVYADDSVTYREGVTVTDNHDRQVDLRVDNTGVDLTKPGTYTVVYSAVDEADNSTQVDATVTVKAKPKGYVSEAELYAKVDEIFSYILAPDMSDLEMLEAIFYYIADHVSYTGSSDKSDWVKAAYSGITRGRGDCFTYFSLAKAMLTRAGFETIPVKRVPARTRHYWNLVKYNGEWYHFDALPNLTYYRYVCLLRTDAEVAEFSKNNRWNHRFYTFDHTGIPATATTPLDIERKVIYD